jgi:S1-C subfamily serine protease
MTSTCLKFLLAVLPACVAAAAGCESAASRTDGGPTANRLDMLRHVPAAEVYRQCKDSVVTLGFARKDAADPKTTHTEFGSGIIIHESGYVLTCCHILRHGGDGAAGIGGRDYPCRVVASDAKRDLAILKVDAGRPLSAIRLGYSRDLVVGEPIVTIGSPFGMGLSVTTGIVSALGRSTKSDFAFFPHMIQTSTPINPGTSGGPLLNSRSELVGVNATARLNANDIGFAIPVDLVRQALPEILDPEGRQGFLLGLTVATDGAATVKEVAKGSPAEAAGVRAGDAVLAVGKATVANGVEFYFALMDARGGQPLALRILRDGQTVDLTATPTKAAPKPAPKTEAKKAT